MESSTKSFVIKLLLILVVAVASASGGYYLWKTTQQDSIKPDVFLSYPQPRVIADFALIDNQARPFSLDNLKNQWTLVFFGFTYCPDICPGTLAQLAEVNKILEKKLSPDNMPKVLFVSVDPERDTPEVINNYIQYFDPNFIGVTGEDRQLRALTLQLGIAYHIADHEPGAAQYDVDHSAGIVLLNPKGKQVGLFPAPHDPKAVAHAMATLMKKGH